MPLERISLTIFGFCLPVALQLPASALAPQTLISSSVEYLHFGGNKPEGRRQEAGGKKEGCKVEGNYNCLSELDITLPNNPNLKSTQRSLALQNEPSLAALQTDAQDHQQQTNEQILQNLRSLFQTSSATLELDLELKALALKHATAGRNAPALTIAKIIIDYSSSICDRRTD
ncbi:MAG: hypothetical protein F6K14_23455 [Symploca sp. SIO2C1]|nr:hypothetical protein [Symploca sp. SIO2C1]